MKRSDDLARQVRGPADKRARWREARLGVDNDLALAEELEAVWVEGQLDVGLTENVLPEQAQEGTSGGAPAAVLTCSRPDE
jgi:hypothetical protein